MHDEDLRDFGLREYAGYVFIVLLVSAVVAVPTFLLLVGIFVGILAGGSYLLGD